MVVLLKVLVGDDLVICEAAPAFFRDIGQANQVVVIGFSTEAKAAIPEDRLVEGVRSMQNEVIENLFDSVY